MPDKGAEGSTVVKAVNSKNSVLSKAVVGKDGKFSLNIKTTTKKQSIKIIVGDGKEYSTQALTIQAK